MVSAIYLIVAGLGTAFLLGLLPPQRRLLAYSITLLTLAVMSWISASWLWALAHGAVTEEIFTAGTAPPFAVNLRMGLAEAALTLLVNLTGLFSALYLKDTLIALERRGMVTLLIGVMALCGIILTRDLFNLFVFIELAVIATAGLILFSRNCAALAAGFKYLIAAQFVSVLLLAGSFFAYHFTGTLNIDGMAESGALLVGGGSLALFLIFIALTIELKPFPANGWALDIYESAHPGYAAIVSAAAGAAALFAMDKVLLIGGAPWASVATALGLTTFVAANLLALPQQRDRRLLGYSSVGQLGLVLAVLGQRELLGDWTPFIAFGLLVSHAVAKAGLFWLSGLVAGRQLTDWAALRRQPLALFAFITFIMMLIGLPPFPGFYAKWELVRLLAAEGQLLVVGLILFATLLEVGYLFRWFGYIMKREVSESDAAAVKEDESLPAIRGDLFTYLPIAAAVAAAWGLGYLWGELSGRTVEGGNLLLALPLLFALLFLALERTPTWFKNSLAIAGMVAFFLFTWQEYDPLRLIFAVIFTIGGAIILLASYQIKGQRIGFYPSTMLMYAGLVMLIRAEDAFAFFAAWELLTIGSYFLILRGKHSEPHALSYLAFSMAGAYAILAGFGIAAQGAFALPLAALAEVAEPLAPWVFLLLAIGFMTKTAAIGLHIWLPGAHAEAETDVSPMVSGVLLKAGLYGLMVLLLAMGSQQLYGVELTHLMLWIGALSALIGNLMAIFQEDAKRLLAYSSIGQMGYALFGLALMNHLGWLMALMFVINHYVYKSMLFLSVGGVYKRTGTRLMYRMGGLINLMPLSFIAVLIGIIAISGVPPLSGFGGRWITYNALLDGDARLVLVILFLAGPIAFLYLFRLIHSIFLGQLKDEHRQIREAPFWLILPQMIYVAILMVVAIVPGLVLEHVDLYLVQFFPHGGLEWSRDGITTTISSGYGYWNPVAIMLIVGVIFATLFVWLLFVNRRAQRVKQFNIVYSAERPYRPETTHFAWNFFAPYRKALGFLTAPLATRFWGAITDLLHSAGDLGRRIYTGNGQTYAYHLLLFVVAVYLLRIGSGS